MALSRSSREAVVLGCQQQKMERRLCFGRFERFPPGSRRASFANTRADRGKCWGYHARTSSAHRRCGWRAPPPSGRFSISNSVMTCGFLVARVSSRATRKASGVASASAGNCRKIDAHLSPSAPRPMSSATTCSERLAPVRLSLRPATSATTASRMRVSASPRRRASECLNSLF